MEDNLNVVKISMVRSTPLIYFPTKPVFYNKLVVKEDTIDISFTLHHQNKGLNQMIEVVSIFIYLYFQNFEQQKNNKRTTLNIS